MSSRAQPGDRSPNGQSGPATAVDPFVEVYGDYGTDCSEAALDLSERQLFSAMGVMPPIRQFPRLPGDPYLREEPYFNSLKPETNGSLERNRNLPSYNEDEDDFGNSWEAGLEAIEAFDWGQDPSGNQDAEPRVNDEHFESAPISGKSQLDSSPHEANSRIAVPLEMPTPLHDGSEESLTSTTNENIYSNPSPKLLSSLEDKHAGETAPSTPYHDAPKQLTPSSPWIESPSPKDATSSETTVITTSGVSRELENKGTASGPTAEQSGSSTIRNHATKLENELVDSDTDMEDVQMPENIRESIAQSSPPVGTLVPPAAIEYQSSAPDNEPAEVVMTIRPKPQGALEAGYHEQEHDLVLPLPSGMELVDLQDPSKSDNNADENGPISPSLTDKNNQVVDPLTSEAAHVSETPFTAVTSPDVDTDIGSSANIAVETHVREGSAEYIHSLKFFTSQEHDKVERHDEAERASPKVPVDDAPAETTSPSAAPMPVDEANEPDTTEPSAQVQDSGSAADEQVVVLQSTEITQPPINSPIDQPLPTHIVADLPTIVEEKASSATQEEVQRGETSQPKQGELGETSDVISSRKETAEALLKLKIESRIWNESLPFSRQPSFEDTSIKQHDTPDIAETTQDDTANGEKNFPESDDSRLKGAAAPAGMPVEEGTPQPFLAGLEEAAAGLPIVTSVKSGSAPADRIHSDASRSSLTLPEKLLEKDRSLSPSPSGILPTKADGIRSLHDDESAADHHIEAPGKADDLPQKQDTLQEEAAPSTKSTEDDVTNIPPDESASAHSADDSPATEPGSSPAPAQAGKKKRARPAAKKTKTAKSPAAAFKPDDESGSEKEAPTKKKQKRRTRAKTPAKSSATQTPANALSSKSASKLAQSKPQPEDKTTGHESQTDAENQPTDKANKEGQIQDAAVSTTGTTTESKALIPMKQDSGANTPTKTGASSARTAAPSRAARPAPELSYGKRETRGEVKMRLDVVEQAKRQEELANTDPDQGAMQPQDDDEDEVIDIVDGDALEENNMIQTQTQSKTPSKSKGKEKAEPTPAKPSPRKSTKETKISGAAATRSTPRATRSRSVKSSTADASDAPDAEFKTPTGRKRKSTEAFQKDDTPQAEGSQSKRQTRHASAVQRKMDEENNVGKRTRSAKKM